MKSQSSKSELDRLLTEFRAYFAPSDFFSTADFDKPDEPRAEAKAKLLELALSCNLKKVKVPEADNAWDVIRGKYTTEDRQREIIYATATNAAIDTMEQNIRDKFR